jgi:twinkle protein
VIYVAVDADRKGEELGQELIRRLGAMRCRTVTYPEGCKDANEVLVKHGKEALRQTLAEAPETPETALEGVFTAKDMGTALRQLFEKGMERGAETGWPNFDKYCTFETGRLCVVTGVPGSGKSEFIDELTMRLNLRHGWKIAYFSPENMPLTYHLRKLMEKVTGQRFKEGCMEEENYAKGVAYLTGNYSFIMPKEDFKVEHILATAEELVRRKGIKIFAVDPFNRFEHLIPQGQTETQYISAVLDRFTNFAVRNDCLVILAAHPRKMNKIPGHLKDPTPTLYDVNGSAAFYNKCDFGLVVERDRKAEATRIHIRKVRFRHLGGNGEATFAYNTVNGRYAPCEIDVHTEKACDAVFDNAMWGEPQ